MASSCTLAVIHHAVPTQVHAGHAPTAAPSACPLLQAALHAHCPAFCEVAMEELLPREALQGLAEAGA